MVEATSIGPIAPSTRDALRDYKELNKYSNYDSALRALLAEYSEVSVDEYEEKYGDEE